MAHPICSSDTGETFSHFQWLVRTLFAPNVEPETRLEHLFEHETDEFDLNYAFLSSIDLENGAERFEIVHGSHDVLEPGTTVQLSNTYCRKTIADPEGTVAINDALGEGWGDDPAYDTFELGSYLGTTVPVADELYGTLCFVDTAAREDPLVDAEKALVEMYGQWVGYVLTLRNELSILETRFDAIDRRPVPSETINAMMDALTCHTRRAILVTLLGDATGTSVDALERQLPHEKARISLYHVHLPKLASSGFIEWDTDANTISAGPKFSEVEPLVQLLNEYETVSPE